MATTKQIPVPSTMKAVRIDEYGDTGKLKLEEVPMPAVGDDQVLVKIHYAGLNPVDWKIRSGQWKAFMQSSFPLILGRDLSGEVVRNGNAAGRFAPGARVFGWADGTYAEYAAPLASDIAPMPQAMDFATAAALPTSGSTALQIIRDAVKVRPGMRILVTGAAGSVGSFACQIARQRGAEVIGTAAGEDVAYLKSLGIAQVIDYERERFEEVAGQVDAVVDLVGGQMLRRSYGIVKKGGVIVNSIGQIDEAKAEDAGIRGVNFRMKNSAADLAELASLVESGAVKPRIGAVLGLSETRTAQELGESGQARGKILLKIA